MENIINKHRNKYHRDLVFYEPSEWSFIADAILEEFPNYNKEDVQQVLNYVCASIVFPYPTDVFIDRVKMLCKTNKAMA